MGDSTLTLHSVRTLDQLLAVRAASAAETTFLWTDDGSVSYAAADADVDRFAAGLVHAGVRPGDRVVLLMANSATQVLLWLAINRVGAVSVPVNAALTGELLARSLRTVQPVLIVVDAEFAATLTETLRVAGCEATSVYVHGDAAVRSGTAVRDLATLRRTGAVHRPKIDDLDPAIILFTSGSTGVPKACVLSHRYVVRAGEIHAKYLRLTDEDVLFTPFPLFHIDAATLTVGTAVAVGATAALARRFSASRFWDEVHSSGATVFNFMGATANILWKQRPAPAERNHRVRLAWGVPMPACEPGWAARFGFPLLEVYGLTDAGVPAYQPLDEPRIPGSCGRIVAEYDVAIVDEHDNPVPAGTLGEIVIRGREPGLLMTEYFGLPEATATALRGGWFHTGDLARLDSAGNLFFGTRGKEVIRRRGENIAATDVEHGIDAHGAVRESAAVGVPSELSEDDIRLFVVLQPGAELSARQVIDHARRQLPRHMVPRYVEIVSELPKTPTEKIERLALAARPLTSTTWDGDISAFLPSDRRDHDQ